MWSGTSRTIIWELVRPARLGPTPDILNQKFWGWALTSTQSHSQPHWSLRTIALGASWEVLVGWTILCLSSNIFPFCPVPPSSAVKTITASLISKSRFVFLYLPLKPVLHGSGQDLAHILPCKWITPCSLLQEGPAVLFSHPPHPPTHLSGREMSL